MTRLLFDEFDQAWNLVMAHDEIFLTTHKSADGDGYGSMLALAKVLERMGKRVHRVIADGAPLSLRFLSPGDVVATQHDFVRKTLVIVLDSSELSRTGFERDIVQARENDLITIINIDHHQQVGGSFGDVHLIDPEASSTAEIVYYFLTYNGVEIEMDVASCLLTGIFSDTGSFQHSNTSARVFGIAADLVGKGARLHKISKQMFTSKTLPSMRIWGEALSRVRIADDLGLAVSYLTWDDLQKFDATLEDVSGVVSVINTIPGIKASLLIVEAGDGLLKCSLRSEEGRGVDVSRLARLFGGGGHRLAAGFSIPGHIHKRHDGHLAIV
jgi:bifunctional oligoribonuclease and PAP phosphatase NrnA